MVNVFQKAQKSMAKLRIGLCGPSGSGKSYSALMLAIGIQSVTGDKIAAIDTERGSLSLYADKAEFDVVELKPPYDPRAYVDLIAMAERMGYGIIIIDSITHEWSGEGGVLDMVEKMPGTNSFQKWGQATPLHQKFVDSMLKSNCHIIATMRSKTEYVENEKNGKRNFAKAGSGPQQREGIDYEFTLILDIERDNHIASANKDRTQLWDTRFELINPQHGVELMRWLSLPPSLPVTPPSGREAAPSVTSCATFLGEEGNAPSVTAVTSPSGREAVVPQFIQQPELDVEQLQAVTDEIARAARMMFASNDEYEKWVDSNFGTFSYNLSPKYYPEVLQRLKAYAKSLKASPTLPSSHPVTPPSGMEANLSGAVITPSVTAVTSPSEMETITPSGTSGATSLNDGGVAADAGLDAAITKTARACFKTSSEYKTWVSSTFKKPIEQLTAAEFPMLLTELTAYKQSLAGA